MNAGVKRTFRTATSGGLSPGGGTNSSLTNVGRPCHLLEVWLARRCECGGPGDRCQETAALHTHEVTRGCRRVPLVSVDQRRIWTGSPRGASGSRRHSTPAHSGGGSHGTPNPCVMSHACRGFRRLPSRRSLRIARPPMPRVGLRTGRGDCAAQQPSAGDDHLEHYARRCVGGDGEVKGRVGRGRQAATCPA